jgi:hypothetical protein
MFVSRILIPLLSAAEAIDDDLGQFVRNGGTFSKVVYDCLGLFSCERL